MDQMVYTCNNVCVYIICDVNSCFIMTSKKCIFKFSYSNQKNKLKWNDHPQQFQLTNF